MASVTGDRQTATSSTSKHTGEEARRPPAT